MEELSRSLVILTEVNEDENSLKHERSFVQFLVLNCINPDISSAQNQFSRRIPIIFFFIKY